MKLHGVWLFPKNGVEGLAYFWPLHSFNKVRYLLVVASLKLGTHECMLNYLHPNGDIKRGEPIALDQLDAALPSTESQPEN